MTSNILTRTTLHTHHLLRLLLLLLMMGGGEKVWGQTYENKTTTYDFEDNIPLFTGDSRVTVAIENDNELSSKVVTFTCAGNAQNGYSFAHYDFSDLVKNASIVTLEFDYYNTNGGRAILSIGDAKTRGTTGGSSKTTYNGTGALFRIGSDKDKAYINDKSLTLANYTDKWLHVKVEVNVESNKVTYSVKEGSTTLSSGTNSDYYNDAASCTQIDIFGYINNSKCAKLDNLSITASVDPSKVFADYKIKYVADISGVETELKTARTANAQATTTCTILDSDKAAIDYGGKHYIYVSDNASTTTVAANGSSVVTIRFREAAKYNYTVTSSYSGQTLPFETSGWTWEDVNTVTIQYPRFQQYGTRLVERGPVSNNLQTSITVNNDNTKSDITYTDVSPAITNLYRLAEAEDLGTGLTTSATSFSTRVSNGQIIYGASGDLVTLPPGKYIFTLGVIGGSTDSPATYTVKAGGLTLLSEAKCQSNMLQLKTSEEFTLETETTLSFTADDTGSNKGIDLIYIQKTSAPYVVHFVDEDGNTIHDEMEAWGTPGATVAVPDGMEWFDSDDGAKRYIYQSGATGTIAMDNSTVVTLVYSVAPMFNYTVNAVDESGTVLQTIASGTAPAENNKAVGIPRVINVNGIIYSGNIPTSGSSGTSREEFDLDEDNKVVTHTYTPTDISKAVFFVEAEDIEGVEKISEGNVAARCSYMAGGFLPAANTDYTITTITEPGLYKLTAACYTGSGWTYTFKANGESIHTLSGSWNETTSGVFFVKEPTTITVSCSDASSTQKANNALDYVYIYKSPMDFSPKTGTITADGQTLQAPLYNAEGAITYTSDKETVASVSEDGVISPVNNGTATITATDATGATATFTVTVSGITGISWSKESYTYDLLSLGMNNPNVNDAGAPTLIRTNYTGDITYTSSNPSAAKIIVDNNGNPHLHFVGKSDTPITITATPEGNLPATSYQLTVTGTDIALPAITSSSTTDTFTLTQAGVLPSGGTVEMRGITMSYGLPTETALAIESDGKYLLKVIDANGYSQAWVRAANHEGDDLPPVGVPYESNFGGTYYKFVTTLAGTLKVAGNLNTPKLYCSDGSEPSSNKGYNDISVKLEANKTYYLYNDIESRPLLSSFSYSPDLNTKTESITMTDLMLESGQDATDGKLNRKIPRWKVTFGGTTDIDRKTVIAADTYVQLNNQDGAGRTGRGELYITPDVPEGQADKVKIQSITVYFAGGTIGNLTVNGYSGTTVTDLNSFTWEESQWNENANEVSRIKLRFGSGTATNVVNITKIEFTYTYTDDVEFDETYVTPALEVAKPRVLTTDLSAVAAQAATVSSPTAFRQGGLTYALTNDGDGHYTIDGSGNVTPTGTDARGYVATVTVTRPATTKTGDASVTYFGEASTTYEVEYIDEESDIDYTIGETQVMFRNNSLDLSSLGEGKLEYSTSDNSVLAIEHDNSIGVMTIKGYGIAKVFIKNTETDATMSYTVKVKRDVWDFSKGITSASATTLGTDPSWGKWTAVPETEQMEFQGRWATGASYIELQSNPAYFKFPTIPGQEIKFKAGLGNRINPNDDTGNRHNFESINISNKSGSTNSGKFRLTKTTVYDDAEYGGTIDAGATFAILGDADDHGVSGKVYFRYIELSFPTRTIAFNGLEDNTFTVNYLDGEEQDAPTPSVLPATPHTYFFESADPSIATVDPWTGKVTTLQANASVTIRAYALAMEGASSGNAIPAEYTLRILSNASSLTDISIPELLYLNNSTTDTGLDRDIPNIALKVTGDASANAESLTLRNNAVPGTVTILPRYQTGATGTVAFSQVQLTFTGSPSDKTLNIGGTEYTLTADPMQTFTFSETDQLVISMVSAGQSVDLSNIRVIYSSSDGKTNPATLLDDAPTDVVMTFSMPKAINGIGENFTNPLTISTPSSFGGTLTYSSNHTENVSVDASSGIATTHAEGETTITATFAGNDYFKPANTTYTINTTLTLDDEFPTYTFTVLRNQIIDIVATSAATLTMSGGVTCDEEETPDAALTFPGTETRYATADGTVTLSAPTGKSVTITTLNVYYYDVNVMFDYPQDFLYFDTTPYAEGDFQYGRFDQLPAHALVKKGSETVDNNYHITFRSEDPAYVSVAEQTGKASGVAEKLDGATITMLLTAKDGRQGWGYQDLSATYKLNIIPFGKTWNFTSGATDATLQGLKTNEYIADGGSYLTLKARSDWESSDTAKLYIPVREGMLVVITSKGDNAQDINTGNPPTINYVTYTNTKKTSSLPLTTAFAEYSYFAAMNGYIEISNGSGYYQKNDSKEVAQRSNLYIQSIEVKEPQLEFQKTGSALTVAIRDTEFINGSVNAAAGYDVTYSGTSPDDVEGYTVDNTTGTVTTEYGTFFSKAGRVVVTATATPQTGIPNMPLRPLTGSYTLSVADMQFNEAYFATSFTEQGSDYTTKGVIESAKTIEVTTGADGTYTLNKEQTAKYLRPINVSDAELKRVRYTCTTFDGGAEGNIRNYLSGTDEGKYAITLEGAGTVRVTATLGNMHDFYDIVVKTNRGFRDLSPTIAGDADNDIIYNAEKANEADRDNPLTMPLETGQSVKYSIMASASQAYTDKQGGTPTILHPIDAAVDETTGAVTIKAGGCGVVQVRASVYDSDDTPTGTTADYYLTVAYPLEWNATKGLYEHTWAFNRYMHLGNGTDANTAVGTDFYKSDGSQYTQLELNAKTSTVQDSKWKGYNASNPNGNDGRFMWRYEPSVHGNNGLILQETAGLQISALGGSTTDDQDDNSYFAARNEDEGSSSDNNPRSIALMNGAKLTIPCLKAGDYVDLTWGRYGAGNGKSVTLQNLTDIDGSTVNFMDIANSFLSNGEPQGYYTYRVKADGDVSFTCNDKGTLRIMQIHVYRGKYVSPMTDQPTAFDLATSNAQAGKDDCIFLEGEENNAVTLTYRLLMNASTAKTEYLMETWDNSLEQPNFNGSIRPYKPGGAVYAIPQFKVQGGYGKAYLLMESYDEDGQYVVARQVYTITVGKRVIAKEYPYTWDFTSYFADTKENMKEDYGTWKNDEDSYNIDFENKVSTARYGYFNYESYYVAGAQLVDSIFGPIPETEGLGFTLAGGSNPTGSLSLYAGKDRDAAAKHRAGGPRRVATDLDPSTSTSEGHLAISSGSSIRIPSLTTNHRIYISCNLDNPGKLTLTNVKRVVTSVSDDATETLDEGEYDVNINDLYYVYKYVPQADGDVTVTLNADASIYKIGVTDIRKEKVSITGDTGWATESREQDIDHRLTGYFTCNDLNAYAVNYDSYDLNTATVALTEVADGYVKGSPSPNNERHDAVVLKLDNLNGLQKLKDYDASMTSTSRIPLFVPAITTPRSTMAQWNGGNGNLMRPNVRAERHQHETTNFDSGTMLTQLGTDWTKFLLTNVHWTFKQEGDLQKEETENEPSGDDYEGVKYADAAGFYRMHVWDQSNAGNSHTDNEMNTMPANTAYLCVPTSKLPVAVWNASSGSEAPRRNTIAIRGGEMWNDQIPDPTDGHLDDADEEGDGSHAEADDSGAWYTLSGVRLHGKPTTAGLYIHGRKKVMVK